MDLNNCFSNVFILFLLFAGPVFTTGRLKQLNSEIYEIDYRGPETHSYMPPPKEEHGGSKWPYTENTTNMVKKLRG